MVGRKNKKNTRNICRKIEEKNRQAASRTYHNSNNNLFYFHNNSEETKLSLWIYIIMYQTKHKEFIIQYFRD